jgi:hypothetical protein
MNSNNSTVANIYVTRLENISRYIAIYVNLFYLIIGNTANLFKVFFCLQKPVRTCSCTVYILIATFADFITLNNIPILKLLSNLYPSNRWINITFRWTFSTNTITEEPFVPSQKAINICKVRNYFHMWSTDVSIQLLLFASIDRLCTSLKKTNRRENHRVLDFFCSYLHAYKISLFICILWAIISLHHFFNFNLISNSCVPGDAILWTVWILGVHCLIPSSLMIVFGTLTVMNMRKSSASLRHQSQTDRKMLSMLTEERQECCNDQSYRHHIETQLTRMTITEILLTVLTSLPYAVYVMFRLLTAANENNRSTETIARDKFIELLTQLTMYFEPSCGFYIYFFTLTTLRERFLHTVLQNIRVR